MNRKPFSQELYDECDGDAKAECALLFRQLGFQVEIPAENMQDDVKIAKGGTTQRLEVAKKRGWKTARFPSSWDNVHVTSRRRRSKADGFVMFNNPLTACLIACMADIKASGRVTKSNKFVEDEEFIDCKRSIFAYWRKKDGVWFKRKRGASDGKLHNM